MADTIGLVQSITIKSSNLTCAWIGPTPDNTEILLVQNDGTPEDSAFANSLIRTLVAASTNYRQVVAVHADDDSNITQVRIEPI